MEKAEIATPKKPCDLTPARHSFNIVQEKCLQSQLNTAENSLLAFLLIAGNEALEEGSMIPTAVYSYVSTSRPEGCRPSNFDSTHRAFTRGTQSKRVRDQPRICSYPFLAALTWLLRFPKMVMEGGRWEVHLVMQLVYAG